MKTNTASVGGTQCAGVGTKLPDEAEFAARLGEFVSREQPFHEIASREGLNELAADKHDKFQIHATHLGQVMANRSLVGGVHDKTVRIAEYSQRARLRKTIEIDL